MILKTEREYCINTKNSMVIPANASVRDKNDPDFEKKIKLDLLENIFNYLRKNIDRIDLGLDKHNFSSEIVRYVGSLCILDDNHLKNIFNHLSRLEGYIKILNQGKTYPRGLFDIEEIKKIIKGD